jgi:transposase
MIHIDFSSMRIFLKLGATDMRKSINTLSMLVQNEMQMDPFSKSLFVFCNKRREILKILYWDINGFCLWQKRLEKDKFKWPKRKEEILEINITQFNWFLSGLDFTNAYRKLEYARVC